MWRGWQSEVGGFRAEADVREGSVRRPDTQGTVICDSTVVVSFQKVEIPHVRQGPVSSTQGHSTPKPRVLSMNSLGRDPTVAGAQVPCVIVRLSTSPLCFPSVHSLYPGVPTEM